MSALIRYDRDYFPLEYLVLRYSEENKKSWDDLVKVACISHFLFYRDYMDYHSDRFFDHSLMIYKDGKLVAIFPANEKDDNVYSHGGLTFGGLLYGNKVKSVEVVDIFYCIVAYYKKMKIKSIIYKPVPWTYHIVPVEADLYCMYILGFRLKERHLASSIDFRKMLPLAGGRKNQIQKAKKNNIVIVESDNWEGFVNLLDFVLQSRHGTIPVHNAAELELLKHRFPDNIKLWTAMRDGVLLAGVVIYLTSTTVHTQYMASSDDGLNLGALDILIKFVMDLYEQTKRYFCFGISTENDGKELNTGLLYQKESFGARAVVHDIWELEL